jgi:hypothetical protein
LRRAIRRGVDPIGKSHFHALWLSFSQRWVRALLKRYDEGGAALGDQRSHNGTKPSILTPDALTALKERIKTPSASLSLSELGRS